MPVSRKGFAKSEVLTTRFELRLLEAAERPNNASPFHRNMLVCRIRSSKEFAASLSRTSDSKGQ